MKKVFSIMVICLIVFTMFSFSAQTYATEEIDIDSTWNKAGEFFNAPDTPIPIDPPTVINWGSELVNLLTTAGIIISVGVGMILGIKLVFSSVEEKADYKEKLMPYIIGCFVTFGAFGIWKVVLVLLQNSGI